MRILPTCGATCSPKSSRFANGRGCVAARVAGHRKVWWPDTERSNSRPARRDTALSSVHVSRAACCEPERSFGHPGYFALSVAAMVEIAPLGAGHHLRVITDSSKDAGWRSVALRRVANDRVVDHFTLPPVDAQTIVLAMRGRAVVEAYGKDGRWHRSDYAPGR